MALLRGTGGCCACCEVVERSIAPCSVADGRLVQARWAPTSTWRSSGRRSRAMSCASSAASACGSSGSCLRSTAPPAPRALTRPAGETAFLATFAPLVTKTDVSRHEGVGGEAAGGEGLMIRRKVGGNARFRITWDRIEGRHCTQRQGGRRIL